MNKKLTKLVERLERIFPKMELYVPTEVFGEGFNDCAPEHNLSWFEFLEKLDNDGLMISKKSN